MTNEQDIRWHQRFNNFRKALTHLGNAVNQQELSILEEQGLIKAFEFTYELAWNTLKDFYEYQGEEGIQGSRDAIRLAINRELIEDGHTWMEMIKSRQLTVHSYNEETAKLVASDVKEKYYSLFLQLEKKLEKVRSGQQGGVS